jgi:small-conductance mechanosensitive channel
MATLSMPYLKWHIKKLFGSSALEIESRFAQNTSRKHLVTETIPLTVMFYNIVVFIVYVVIFEKKKFFYS